MATTTESMPDWDELTFGRIEKELIYFDTRTRRLIAGTDKINPPSVDKNWVSITAKTALRIAHKAQLVAAVDDFLSNGKVQYLTAEQQLEGDSTLLLGTSCDCIKDGTLYGFFTENETFIPMAIKGYGCGGSIPISQSQFKSLILFQSYSRSMSIPLLEKPPEDYVEFRFYKDGYAIDGTGVVYTGRMRLNDCLRPWRDDKIHLVPHIPYAGNQEYDLSFTHGQMVTVEEFVDICAKRSREDYDAHVHFMESKYRPRQTGHSNMARDMMEDGLIDIYGEPGGWQFNNED